jgi:hypothetical protein
MKPAKYLIPVLLTVVTALTIMTAPAHVFPQANADAGASRQASQAPAGAQDENARKARALIDQMIAALGGQAYLGAQDRKEEGRTYSFHGGRPTGAGAPYWRYWKWPDKERTELTKRHDWIIIHNGDQGSEVTFRGVSPEEPDVHADYMRRLNYSLEWVLRKWLNEPGVALFYNGPSVAAQKQAQQVSIINAHDQSVTIDIDYDSHLPIRKTFTWRDPADRQKNEEGEIYDNYKTVQGIATPLSVTRTHNGDMSNQRFLTSVEYNQNLPDSLFDPHAVKLGKH